MNQITLDVFYSKVKGKSLNIIVGSEHPTNCQLTLKEVTIQKKKQKGTLTIYVETDDISFSLSNCAIDEEGERFFAQIEGFPKITIDIVGDSHECLCLS